jgi:hypothetical protein
MSGPAVAWSSGDFDGDGIVDFNDFVNLNNRWQRSISSASGIAAAVPEPGGMVWLAASLFGWGLVARLGESRYDGAKRPRQARGGVVFLAY